jgi:hypothetical protein
MTTTMAKDFQVTIDDKSMTNALRALQKVTGASFREVVRFETGKILESAIKRTPALQVQKIKENYEKRPVQVVDGKLYFLPASGTKRKYPVALWAKILAAKKRSLDRRLAARGLAKKAWSQLAQTLGIAVKIPAAFSKATHRGKDYPQNATATENKSGAAFFIQGRNTRLYARGTVAAISRAIKGRTSYFATNLRKGVFKTNSEIAARYPGLSVKF